MTIKPQKYRLAFVFNTLYYPFTYPEIIESLKARKYAINAGAPPEPFMNGARNYVSGYIASKLGCFVEVNNDRKLMAVEGTSANNVVAIAEEIIDLSITDFRLSVPIDIDYSELVGAVVVTDSGNPMAAIKRFAGDQYSAFDEILGAESAGYSIRIVPKNDLPGDKSWFDISITPRLSTADREYYIEVVYRKENNVDDVLAFAAQIEAKVSAIIDTIRGS